VNDNKLIARSLKTSKEYIIDHSVDWSCLMMLKTIFDSYQHEINLSEIIGLGGDGVVVKKTVEIGGRTQEFAVKYTRVKDLEGNDHRSLFGRDFRENLFKNREFDYGSRIPGLFENFTIVLDVIQMDRQLIHKFIL